MVPTAQPIDATKGDEFGDNVNAADATHPRRFYTVIATTDGAGKKWSQRSVRPAIAATNPDAITTLGGATVTGTTADFFAPLVPALAMQVALANCTEATLATHDACATVFMKWQIGATNASPFQSRANAFGAIYHSTPALVGVPNDFLRDESYTAFTDLMVKRPPVLYTATTDGQLHAFKVDKSINDTSDTFTIDTKANNELWSFMPPAVLPKMRQQYPDVESNVLDGAPVVKDVVFVRSDADAKSGGAGALWHTVLVSGFGNPVTDIPAIDGRIGSGYYALDVTKPVVAAGGPTFLWQLTSDLNGNPLFGEQSGTPAIATLFFGPSGAGGVGAQEYAVAILPGGSSGAPTGVAPGCSLVDPPVGLTSLVDPLWPARTRVQCWANSPSRSLTIVRLDTGEVIRSFRMAADGPASILPRSVNQLGQYATLYAPISGRPVVFPATTGAVADRAFVGDRDGLIWRIDFSNPDPQRWTMRLFFDTYSKQVWNAGQPIETPPVLSVDRLGNVTMAVSTGDQDTFLSTIGMKNYIWSVLENSTATPTFQSKALWYKLLSDGERVSGPMTLFASNLFYTTFTPPPATDPNKCSNGVSSVCGVHYMNARNIDAITHLPILDGSGGAVSVPSLNTATDPCLAFGQSIIFGAGITQRPTCNADATSTDPYLGSGSHTGLADFTPGKFDLVVQTGPNQVTNPGSGASSSAGGITNTLAIELAPPMSPTRIDSWAAVVE
jgi:type IV pilus assembly protein PilY1